MAKTSTKRAKRPANAKGAPRPKKLSPRRKPDELSVEEWQVALRREFGLAQGLELANVGGRKVFSEFLVTNPQSGGTYRVAVRGEGLGDNYCSCPDYATNTLGTCKHIEYTLARLRERASARRALAGGYRPPWPEVFLRYGEQREVVFNPGQRGRARLQGVAAEYFDDAGVLRAEAYGRFGEFLERARVCAPTLRCYDDTAAFVKQVCADQARNERLDELFGVLGKPQAQDGRRRQKGNGHEPEVAREAAG